MERRPLTTSSTANAATAIATTINTRVELLDEPLLDELPLLLGSTAGSLSADGDTVGFNNVSETADVGVAVGASVFLTQV